ncbi:hypothetical protein SAMN05216403_1227 [Nitrosospira multiformis ATCC 25196]|uniref:Uncharacterized protein n=1 Tax=Nitrosospira multiformis (strain ATCC 25196 / NCIMB 11849 / C 71) TaxID=323848 RepID=Q2Y5B1_NITMU|nr:hypothetical protein Nmul_A2773 [Nitrosospira multiformis ATCC 25196]SEG01147.1 hypothetical protein SAMN05216403_1227 [Nitrosospira multiformis ATCC 25196]
MGFERATGGIVFAPLLDRTLLVKAAGGLMTVAHHAARRFGHSATDDAQLAAGSSSLFLNRFGTWLLGVIPSPFDFSLRISH